MEKRKNRRVGFHAEATVTAGEISISGKLENLSMKGALLNTKERLPGEDYPLQITIFLAGAASNPAITLKGRVIRQDDSGIAVEFKEMDLDSFIHLRNVVRYNSSNADETSEEFYKSILPDW